MVKYCDHEKHIFLCSFYNEIEQYEIIPEVESYQSPECLSKINEELDKILVSLMDRNFLVFDFGKKMKVSLKPLAKQLFDTFEQELVKEMLLRVSAFEKADDDVKKLIQSDLPSYEKIKERIGIKED